MPRRRAGRRAARKDLPGFGIRGRLGRRGQLVRGVVERGLVRVLWSEQGRRVARSWPDTPEHREVAVAYGAGVLARLTASERSSERSSSADYEPLTLRGLWDKYAKAEVAPLRPRSQDNYLKRWRKFERFKGRDFPAAQVTRETLDDFRAEMKKLDHEINQIAAHVRQVKSVFVWAVDNDHLPPTKVTSYRFKRNRDDRALVIAEYTPDETRRLLEQFDPKDARDWRWFALTVLFAFAGPRQTAARYLMWDDVDLDAATITWRAEHDKLGKHRVQPVPSQVVEALWVAYGWRLAFGYEGRFVFFRPGAGLRDASNGFARSARARARAEAKPDQPCTYSAYNTRLRAAEASANVAHVPYGAAHRFRRFALTEAHRRTGNLELAGQYIGDSDVRTLQRSYLRERPEEVRRVADEMAATGQNFSANRTPSATVPKNTEPSDPEGPV